MILLIDNYDSFVHNLARYFREAGAAVRLVRNDAFSADALLSVDDIEAIVISPGPNAPAQAGVSMDLLRSAPLALPVLGVCLGHQCLVERFGGETVRSREPLHGEASDIDHDGAGVFQGMPSPLPAGRYHSLVANLDPSNDELVVCARSQAGELMGVRHRTAPWHGVQFHPESLLTPHGRAMIDNFLKEIG